MKTMLEIYQSTYRAMVPPLNPFEFMQSPRTERDVAGDAPRPTAANATPGGSRRTKAARQDSDEVKDLKRRIAELERLVFGKKRDRA
jgi:hypothetical protein